jgi:hypothetical protein
MVVKESGSYATLSGKFTIEKITTPGGETKESLTTSNPDYQTTNMTEWREKMDRLEDLRADINARQDKLLDGGSGSAGFPNPFSGLSRMQSIFAIVAIAGAALLLIRN